MDIEEALVSEEGVDESGGCVTHSQETREGLCSGTKMWKLTNVLGSVFSTSFEWVVLMWESCQHSDHDTYLRVALP